MPPKLGWISDKRANTNDSPWLCRNRMRAHHLGLRRVDADDPTSTTLKKTQLRLMLLLSDISGSAWLTLPVASSEPSELWQGHIESHLFRLIRRRCPGFPMAYHCASRREDALFTSAFPSNSGCAPRQPAVYFGEKVYRSFTPQLAYLRPAARVAPAGVLDSEWRVTSSPRKDTLLWTSRRHRNLDCLSRDD